MQLIKSLDLFRSASIVASNNSSNWRDPDADTLMILAGPSGSGKSSILQAAYREGLPLFGADYDPGFRESCKDKSYREYYDRKMAMQKSSFFRLTTSSRFRECGHCLDLCCYTWTFMQSCLVLIPLVIPAL